MYTSLNLLAAGMIAYTLIALIFLVLSIRESRREEANYNFLLVIVAFLWPIWFVYYIVDLLRGRVA